MTKETTKDGNNKIDFLVNLMIKIKNSTNKNPIIL